MILRRTFRWITLAGLLTAGGLSSATLRADQIAGTNTASANGQELAGPFKRPVQRIAAIEPQAKESSVTSPVHLRGTVVGQRTGEYVVIRDETGMAFAETASTALPKLNDTVGVVGIPVWEGSQLRIRNAILLAADRETPSPAQSALSSERPEELPVLTKAWQVRDLTQERAAWKFPVRLRAIAIPTLPTASSGIWTRIFR